MKKTLVALAVAALACGAFARRPASNDMPDAARPEIVAAVERAAQKAHPRLFADADGFARIKARIETDELMKLAAEHVRAVADMMVPTPPSERIKQGKRLLTVSRTALYRIATLAMAYRLYGDKAHLDRAVAELRAVCAFEDWNPSHFLDVGEMSLAVAVGYDWLYNDLDEATRKEIAAGLRRHGLEAGLMRLWWIRASNNWGQVCHAGILSAALALAEENPSEAARFVQRAVDNLPISMKALAPNGNYPEGPGYWSYGMHFNVIAIDLLEGTLGSDFGLASKPGFREAGFYPDIVTGPSGQPFNYADGGAGRRSTHPALWWFAKRFKSPDVLRYQELGNFKAYAARRDKRITTHGHRLFPFALFWIETPPSPNEPSRLPLVWDGQGPVPITIQRSSWNDDEALFVGLKGGSPSGPHGHMDGSAKFVRVRAEPPSEVALDLSSLYTNATEVLRGGKMSADGKNYVLNDIVRGFRPGGEVRWSMITCAEAQVDGTAVVGSSRRGATQECGPWRRPRARTSGIRRTRAARSSRSKSRRTRRARRGWA